ncbi:MAG: glycosyl hydrolase family 18 protein [Eubacteriales bacterium]|nr:glycosyl hydrolase family 18 protein [Eubacteriales bacterium]
MTREERDERTERARRPRRRRRRRRLNPRALPVLIALALAVLVGGFLAGSYLYEKYSPSKEMMDGNEYFGLSGAEDMAVIVDDSLVEDKARLVDGRVYLNVETVYQYVNSRFYWDSTENLYLYALPTELVSVDLGSSEYTVAKAQQSEDYVILRADGSEAYVALDFIQKYTNLTYEYWEEPNRVRVVTSFGTKDVVTAQKTCAVRYQAGIKSPILTKVPKGDTMYVLEEPEEIDEWTRVLTSDGYIGYVKDNRISAVSQTEIAEPEFEEPEYTSISKDYKINLSWHMVTNQEANDQLLNKVADAKGLNTISPTWFSIEDTEGNISSLASQSYVNYAHQKGLEVWALVDNFKEGVSTYETLSRTSSRQRLVNQLAAAAIQYGLDGINVDFETISEECSRAYLQFIRELSIMCRINGIVLSVDNYVPTASTDHYDRAEQGVFADYVIIMGYDEHYSGSEEAGSVASHDFVEQGIVNTLKEVPKEKVINAVPFYTRFWKTEVDGSVSSEALGMDAADQKVTNNEAEKVWDETTHQYYVEFDYEGSTYQMWMEEETSIEDKMQLIKQYELAGVASWRLGYERATIWDVILKYVN